MNTKYVLVTASAFLLFNIFCTPSARAQSVTGSVTPNDPYDIVDENGVNVITGLVSITSEDLEIGDVNDGSGTCLADGGWKKEQSNECAPQAPAKNTKSDIDNENLSKLSLKRFWTSDSSWQGGNLIFGWSTNWSSNISLDKGKITATLGNQSYYFASATMNSTRGDGAKIVSLGSLSYKVTTKNGTEITYLPSYGPVSRVLYPNGRSVNISYASRQGCGNAYCNDYKYFRIQQVTSSDGYALQFEYEDDNSSADNINSWMHASKVTAFQSSLESCPPASVHCNFVQSWPSALYTRPTPANLKMTTTLSSGRSVEYVMASGGGRISKIIDSDGNVTQEYSYFSGAIPQQGLVSSVNRAGNVWQYSPTNSLGPPYSMTLDVTAPVGGTKRYIGDKRFGLYEVRDALGRSTKFTYDTKGRILSVIQPEGNGVSLTYDDRGNILTSTQIPKPGSGLGNLVTTSTFPASCTNSKTCNQPTSVVDPRGATTNYTYDPNHGGVLTELPPADDRGIRPETRYAYALVNGSYRISRTSSCILNANCFGSSDEYFATFNFSTLGLNDQIVSGTSTATISNSVVYDNLGNIVQKIDGKGLAQYNYYDSDRRLIGTISVDPDDTGPLPRIGTRYSYNGSGRIRLTEFGTVTGIQLSSLTSMQPTQTIENRYDSLGRLLSSHEMSSGVTRRVNQFSYDGSGRLECATERMILGSWSNLPASACTLAQGSANDDQDRVVKNVYDNAGQLLKIQKAFGTSLQQDYAAYTYTANGKQSTIKDANGNVASTTYDGHDRRSRWIFPSKTAVGSVDPSDYEEYGYDSNGNRTSLRKRDGMIISYQYDALNRNTVKFVPERPGLSSTHTRDVYYSYDLRGLQVSARFDSFNGEGIVSSYDGFGRVVNSQLTMDGVVRTLSYYHDANGNRTDLSHPDGINFPYTYDPLNRITGIYAHLNGIQISYGYNPEGQIEFISRAGGSNSLFYYDVAQRLQSMSNGFPASSFNVAETFQYNPAGQLVERTTSNDAYVWTGAVNVARNYGVNGLNQYVNAGSASFTYDPNGNLTSDGASSFTYDVENRLVNSSGSNNATLRYDPLGRLYETSGGSLATTTRFHYDNDELVGEYNNNGNSWILARRYVHGQNADDPVLWYDGGSLTNPRFLHANHQGSIVAVTSSSGSAPTINSYDEWGIPGVGNQGRFQFTGQAWIAELGMYHYKSRLYSPTLGRFMQVDPVGYTDQMNLYAYVNNDPLNLNDPTGMEGACFYGPSQCGLRQLTPDQKRQQRDLANGIGKVAITAGSFLIPGGWIIRGGGAIAARAGALVRVAHKFLPAASAAASLQRFRFAQAAIQTLKSGGGRIIIGAGAARGGSSQVFNKGAEYAAKYGGRAGDYVKVSATGVTKSGERVSVHAVKNIENGLLYDFKLIIGR